MLGPSTCFASKNTGFIIIDSSIPSQYRHFINETSSTLIAMSNRKDLNPWSRHFAKLALGVPPEMCPAQDAFRQALLSLSAYDLGYRITIASGMTREQVHLNPIVKLSEDLRAEAKTLLDSLVGAKPGPFGMSADDLALATCLALSHRDVSGTFSCSHRVSTDPLVSNTSADSCLSKLDVFSRIRFGSHQ